MAKPQQLYYPLAQHAAALLWQQRLAELGLSLTLVAVDAINARFLRQHPQISLLVDEQGLWLAAQGMKMQPAWIDELHRLKRASLKNELLLRACQMSKSSKILDATAGLGHDGLLLAWMGAECTLIERDPIVYALLCSAREQALQHPQLQASAARIELIYTDAAAYLDRLATDQFDVVYLDPMFPSRHASQNAEKKQAQVKKQMQLLHMLLPEDGIMDLGDGLLPLARAKVRRVIVKRPKHAVFLAQQSPQHQWQGDACRFDGYF